MCINIGNEHNSRTYRATWNIRSIFPFGSDLSHQSLPSPIWREVRQTTHELHTILWQANMAMINSYIMGIHYDIFPINRYFMVFPIARQLTTRGLDTEIRPKLPWLLALTEAPAEFLNPSQLQVHLSGNQTKTKTWFSFGQTAVTELPPWALPALLLRGLVPGLSRRI